MKILVIILILALSITTFILLKKAGFIRIELADNSSKDEKTKNVAFSNALYVCKNPDCDRKFFRLYQVLEQWKYGVGSINDYRSVSLKEELKLVVTRTIASFEKGSRLICPTCQKNNVESTKEFDWMKDAPDFPRLSYTGLKEFRKEFERRKETGSVKIKEIEKIIEEKESLEAFQWQYKLDDSFNSGKNEFDASRSAAEDQIIKMKQDIIEQLALMQEGTPFLKEKAHIATLIKRVVTTAEERYKKQSVIEKAM